MHRATNTVAVPASTHTPENIVGRVQSYSGPRSALRAESSQRRRVGAPEVRRGVGAPVDRRPDERGDGDDRPRDPEPDADLADVRAECACERARGAARGAAAGRT
jgi:hypothetical protein